MSISQPLRGDDPPICLDSGSWPMPGGFPPERWQALIRPHYLHLFAGDLGARWSPLVCGDTHCNHSTLTQNSYYHEVQARGSECQDHPWLYSQIKASFVNIRCCPRSKNNSCCGILNRNVPHRLRCLNSFSTWCFIMRSCSLVRKSMPL